VLAAETTRGTDILKMKSPSKAKKESACWTEPSGFHRLKRRGKERVGQEGKEELLGRVIPSHIFTG